MPTFLFESVCNLLGFLFITLIFRKHWYKRRGDCGFMGSSRIIELNHMFLRLCGPPSIPLSFIVADVLPRWMAYRFRLATDSLSPAVSHHRLRRGIPGYLILFYPHAFVPQRQLRIRQMPSQSVF